MLSNKLQAQVFYTIAFKANDYHVNFYIRVAKRFTSFFDANNPAPARLAAQLTAFTTAQTREDTFYNQIRKSDYTASIMEWDTKRDNNTSSLRAMAQAFAGNPGDPEKQAWGQRLLYLLKHFNVSIADNFEMQGSKTLQFCQCIDSTPDYRAAIDGIGASTFYEAMKDANEHCRELVDLRNEERSQASQDKMVDLRKQTDAEYRDLILITNAYALTRDDEHAYDALINVLNQDINYYEKTVFAGSGGSSSEGSGGSQQGGGTEQGGSTEQGGGTENGGNGTLIDDPELDDNNGGQNGGGTENGGNGTLIDDPELDDNNGGQNGGGSNDNGGGNGGNGQLIDDGE